MNAAPMINTETANPFEAFAAQGYRRLVPIVPPDAEIWPGSIIAKHKNSRGKAPGVKGRDGLWRGLDWVTHETKTDDLDRWHRMGAGIGIKTGDGLLAIDADTLDADHARTIRDIVEEQFGRLPVRIGRYPKALYVIRCSEPYPYTAVEFGNAEQVEILSDGKQFVAHGIHPITNAAYHWPRGVTPFEDLPVVTPAEFDAFLERLRQALPAAELITKAGAVNHNPVDPESLRGELKHIRMAIQSLPNTSAHFGTRRSYRNIGYAIKGALPDNQEEAFEIYSEWCARWEDGENDPDTVADDWKGMHPPRLGANYVYEMAEKYGTFDKAVLWFQPPEDFVPIFDLPVSAAQSDTYQLLTIDELVSRPPPTWLIARHIPEVSVGFLYSEPGAGKTFLALDLALSIAAGRPDWHGDPVSACARPVIYIASEGSFGMRNRILAWLKEREAEAPAKFLMIERTINFMAPDDITKLMRTLRQQPHGAPALIVVDTVSRALPGADENLQKDMTLFVKACDVVRDAFRCAVLGVHHAGKSGDMRGSTVLRGAGDFVFRLTRKEGATVGQLACEKQKDGPDGWAEPYRFTTIGLDDGQSSLVASRADISAGPAVTMTPGLTTVILGEMAKAWDEGRPWSSSPQAKDRFAVRRMVADHGLTAEKAEDFLSVWEESGIIRKEVHSAKHRIIGYRVLAGGVGLSVPDDDIFG